MDSEPHPRELITKSGLFRQIDKTRYEAVLHDRVCPNCKEQTLDLHQEDEIRLRARFYAGKTIYASVTRWVCNGPKGRRCWWMTFYDPKRPAAELHEYFAWRAFPRPSPGQNKDLDDVFKSLHGSL
jgi:hypothetical protein